MLLCLALKTEVAIALNWKSFEHFSGVSAVLPESSPEMGGEP